jgi:hypothetical protein
MASVGVVVRLLGTEAWADGLVDASVDVETGREV